jgi:hypothetical protein
MADLTGMKKGDLIGSGILVFLSIAFLIGARKLPRTDGSSPGASRRCFSKCKSLAKQESTP